MWRAANVWPVHSWPSFGFLTIIIWKSPVTVNHGWLCDSIILTGYWELLLFNLSCCCTISHWAFHLLEDRGMFLYLCAAIPCGTDWICRAPRFQTNGMSCLCSQSSGSAQTKEEPLQQALPSLCLVRFCAACFPVISGSTADESTHWMSFIQKAWDTRCGATCLKS